MTLMTISARIKTAIYRWQTYDKGHARRRLMMFLAPVICLFIFLEALYMSGIRINTTPSLPIGIWRIERTGRVEALRIGDSVAINRAVVPGASRHLMKDVGALPGDVMTRNDNIVYRNGKPLPLSTIQATNSRDEKIDRIEYPIIIPNGYVWVSSRHEWGYDSRYFGAVPQRAVIGKTKLLWAW